MKASLKFRDQQKPLIRAKVPLNILGLPFQSGVAAGDSKELTLQLATFFDSGPSLKIAYKPNDSCTPFTLVLKTGTGPYGSPNSCSMVMSAEFNLVGGSPSFFLHFKPRFGDFSLKTKQSSVSSTKLLNSQTKNGGALSDNGDVNGHVDNPVIDMRDYYYYLGGKNNLTVLPSVWAPVLFSGVQMSARTSLPVRDRAVVRCRWGVRLPESIEQKDSGKKRFQKVPLLVMDKISIEHVDGGDVKAKNHRNHQKRSSEAKGGDVVGDMLYGVRRQIDILQGENGLLRKAVEELKWEAGGGKKLNVPSYHSGAGGREIERGHSVVERQGQRKPHELSCSGKGGTLPMPGGEELNR